MATTRIRPCRSPDLKQSDLRVVRPDDSGCEGQKVTEAGEDTQQLAWIRSVIRR